MISAGVAVEGHGHGLGPGPGPFIPAYPPHRQQEFLRPAPKSHLNSRYNGTSSSLNGTRLVKFSPPGGALPLPVSLPVSLSASGPVNLSAAVKDDHVSGTGSDELPFYPRLYPPPAFTGMYPGPYAGLYSGPYSSLRVASAAAAAAAAGYVAPPPLSPLEHQYSPPATGASPHVSGSGATFVTPPSQFAVRKEIVRERDKRVQGFKVPSGKEGSLKHRILPRLDLPRPKPLPCKPIPHNSTITSTVVNNNNTVLPGNFSKGSLIQLASGELRRVEDMRTEDFVLSAERCPELRLAESTVLKLHEKADNQVVVMLTYNQNRTQVEFEATVEHPFFVYGQGWASCNPERTLQQYGLKVHRLQVGDILVSLTPREHSSSSTTSTNTTYDLCKSREGSTVTTTATTTAMTARQVSRASVSTAPGMLGSMPPPSSSSTSTPGVSSSSMDPHAASRKRRWSAPDQICEEEHLARRIKE